MTKKSKTTPRPELKRGDKVRTCYGAIETVSSVDETRVFTQESIRHLEWYHITKVTKIEEVAK